MLLRVFGRLIAREVRGLEQKRRRVVKEEAILSVSGSRGSDIKLGPTVDAVHLGDFLFFLLFIILDDTESINPHVDKPQISCHLHGVSEDARVRIARQRAGNPLRESLEAITSKRQA